MQDPYTDGALPLSYRFPSELTEEVARELQQVLTAIEQYPSVEMDISEVESTTLMLLHVLLAAKNAADEQDIPLQINGSTGEFWYVVTKLGGDKLFMKTWIPEETAATAVLF